MNKTFIIIIIISINSIAFSQTKIDTLYDFKSKILLDKIDLKLNPTKLTSFKNEESIFTIYNKLNQQNDNYLIEKNSLNYNNSSVLLENNFRGHKIDSFNPNGSPNITFAIISGFFNLILK